MKHRIVVLGAGYAGAIAAGRLAKRLHPDDIEITLVNAEPDFVERVRMHQLAAGQDLQAPPADATSSRAPACRCGWRRSPPSTSTARPSRIVDADGPGEIAYDTLVYALGSAAADHGVPGVAEHAHDIAGKQSALRLRERLADLAAGGTVLVVGGGLTGIEAATEIAEARPDLDVALAARGGLGDWLEREGPAPPAQGLRPARHHRARAHRHHRRRADRRGHRRRPRDPGRGDRVDGRLRRPPDRRGHDPGGLRDRADRRRRHHALGLAPRRLRRRRRRARTGRERHAAADVLRLGSPHGLAGRRRHRRPPDRTPDPPNKIGYTGQCISLGRRDGIVQWVTPDDQPKPSAVTGKTAARLKELICKAAAWSISHPTSMLPTRRRHIILAEEPLATTV